MDFNKKTVNAQDSIIAQICTAFQIFIWHALCKSWPFLQDSNPDSKSETIPARYENHARASTLQAIEADPHFELVSD
jgi:hypothetical protein